jgi:hypothetical protein
MEEVEKELKKVDYSKEVEKEIKEVNDLIGVFFKILFRKHQKICKSV